MKEILIYVFLGIVQGLTEPLPISSSGLVFVLKKLLGITASDLNFEIVVNLGSLLAILLIYKEDLIKLIKNFFKTPIQYSSPNANDSDDYLDKKIYGYSSKKKYMSVAFPPKIIDDSIYEKEPIFWSGNALPDIIFQKNFHI